MPDKLRVGHEHRDFEVTYTCFDAFVVSKFPLVPVEGGIKAESNAVVLVRVHINSYFVWSPLRWRTLPAVIYSHMKLFRGGKVIIRIWPTFSQSGG